MSDHSAGFLEFETIPDRLLRLFRDGIAAAQRVNPRSWRLSANDGALILQVQSGYALSVKMKNHELWFSYPSDNLEDVPTDIITETVAFRRMPVSLIHSFAMAQSIDFLEAHRESWLLSVTEASRRTRTRVVHARTHSPELVDWLAEQVQEALEQPHYIGDPELQLRPPDIHRDYSDSPADLLTLFANDIHLAHSLSPNCWAVYSADKRPMFGVGGFTLLSLNWGDHFTIALHRDEMSPDLQESLRQYEQKRNLRAEYLQHYSLQLDTLATYRDEIVTAHRALIPHLSTARAQRWKDHMPEVVDAVSELTGEELPQPGYIDELLKGDHSAGRPGNGYIASSAMPTGIWLVGMIPEDFDTALETQSLVDAFNVQSRADMRELSSTREEFTRIAKETYGLGDQTTHRAWFFIHAMEINDVVLAHSAGSPMRLAMGRVAGPCEYGEGVHRRAVRWMDPAPFDLGGESLRALVGRTTPNWISPLPADALARIARHMPSELAHRLPVAPKEPGIPEGSDLEPKSVADPASWIRDHFASHGLTYSPIQIAEFYTGLQTKGFVVLSGISGTGKTKIAQHFTEMLPDGNRVVPSLTSTDAGLDIAWTRIMPSLSTQSSCWIPKAHTELFPIIPDRQRVPITLRHADGTYAGRLYESAGLEIGWRKDLAAELRRYPVDTPLGFRPVYSSDSQTLEDLEYVEVIIGDTQTLEQVTEPVSNTLFLSVRPDWRDGTALLGYYNPLTQAYERTDFLDFILDASANFRTDNPVAWFVILDEMNLAHVEYYFADLLSVLESGRMTPADTDDLDRVGFTRDAIRLTYPDTIADAPPHEVHLPPNFYILGTVNMDETTHAFSPKVLDRAFTMELSTVDFSTYQPSLVSSGEPLTDANRHAMLESFTRYGWPGVNKQTIADYVEHYPGIRAALHDLNAQLADHRFHFGYRVFDEVVQFMAFAEANDMFPEPREAFDSAVYMKILPKFSGSEGRVSAPLAVLETWLDARGLERTRQRVAEMRNRLEVDGFVTAF